MADEDEAARKPYRGSVRSGTISLVASVVLVLWFACALWLGMLAPGTDPMGVVASIVIVVSWVLVPVLVVVVLVFGIIALLLNSVPGKILGALGIVLPVVAAVLFWNYIGGFSDHFLR